MYESPNIADTIKSRAKQQGIVIKDMLFELDLGSNTMSNMRHGRMIAADSLARIADYLDCSVDYLLGRTEIPEVNTLDNMVRIYTAARSRNGDAYGEAEVQTVRQSLIDRLRAAPDASDDL